MLLRTILFVHAMNAVPELFNMIFYIVTMLILARYNQRRSLEAVTDYLTGILNRRGLFKNLKERIKIKEKFNVIYFSIDNFKIVNDNYGHTYGDNLLKEISTRMTKKIDGKGVIARIGGTDFAVALDGHDFAKHSGVSAYFRKRVLMKVIYSLIRFLEKTLKDQLIKG